MFLAEKYFKATPCLAAGLLLTFGLTVCAGHVFAQEQWTAIVLEEVKLAPDCSNMRQLPSYGVAWGYASREQAQMAAKRECEKSVPFCHHKYGSSTNEACMSIALEESGGSCGGIKRLFYGEGTGSTAAEADADACMDANYGGHYCKIVFNTCRSK